MLGFAHASRKGTTPPTEVHREPQGCARLVRDGVTDPPMRRQRRRASDDQPNAQNQTRATNQTLKRSEAAVAHQWAQGTTPRRRVHHCRRATGCPPGSPYPGVATPPWSSSNHQPGRECVPAPLKRESRYRCRHRRRPGCSAPRSNGLPQDTHSRTKTPAATAPVGATLTRASPACGPGIPAQVQHVVEVAPRSYLQATLAHWVCPCTRF